MTAETQQSGPEIASLRIGDPPDLWRALGFAVIEDCAWIGRICHRLGAPTSGVEAWSLRGAAIGELPTASDEPPLPAIATEHPNGVVALDHLVIATPDLDRTISAFESAGLRLRRLRETGTSEHPTRQAFFRLGGTIAEVVGPARPSGAGPATFYGLAFTVRDLEVTGAVLGDRLRPAKPAVQPGRRIATLDRSAGSSVPIAFMSAEPHHP